MHTATDLSAGSHLPSQAIRSRHRVALTLVISLFFPWGLTYGLLDVHNKHFQQTLRVGRMESTLLQARYFGAYLLVAVPSGFFVSRYGYRRGILLGLVLFATGALLFIPATALSRFGPFPFSLFVLASGAACFETAANPYVTVLGDSGGGAPRLNLAQAFTGLGSFVGQIIDGLFFIQHGTFFMSYASSVRITYVLTAALVLLLALAFWRTKLPEADLLDERIEGAATTRSLWREARFMASAAVQFFYLSARVGIAAFFINYATEHWSGLPVHSAAFMLSTGMASVTIGRFASIGIMRKVEPANLPIHGGPRWRSCASGNGRCGRSS